MKLLIFLLVSVLYLSCEHPETKKFERFTVNESSANLNISNEVAENGYKVIGVKDGDTIVILVDGKEQTVRFAHIDCPEKKQAFGSRAKQFVSDKCFGSFVQLIVNEKNKFDRNKRLIAEIILSDGSNLNKELVKNGLAWHFKKYSDNQDYAKLEIEARNRKIGIWSDPQPIAPWEWRKGRRE